MRKITLSLSLLLAGLLAGPAASASMPAAARPYLACMHAEFSSLQHIDAILHSSDDSHALQSMPAIEREAMHVASGGRRANHVAVALNQRVSHNPELITQPPIQHMLCLAAHAMHDYSRALRVLVQKGERVEARRNERHGRHDVALGSHGVGPGAPGARAPQDVNITHDREFSHSRERSHSNTRTRSHKQNYERAASADLSRENTLSRNFSSQTSAVVSEGETVTDSYVTLAPVWEQLAIQNRRRERQRARVEATLDKERGWTPLIARRVKALRIMGISHPTPAQICGAPATGIMWTHPHAPCAIAPRNNFTTQSGSRMRRDVMRWEKEHGLGRMVPPTAAQARRLVQHTRASAAAARASARGNRRAQANVRAQIQQQRSAIPPAGQ